MDTARRLVGLPLLGLALMNPSPLPAATLEGPTWRLLSLTEPPPLVTPADLRAVKIRFGAGSVEGFSGCNRFRGTFALEGDRVTLGPLAGTMKACPEPAMSVESAFLSAFAGTLSVAIEGDLLKLTSTKGAVLGLAVEPPAVLEGVTYAVLGYNNGRQGVQSPLLGTTLTIRFENGVASGHAGCNAYRAGYTREEGRLVLTPAAATRKACPGDGVMAQEQLFLEALGSATTFTLQDGRLDLRRADGALALSARASE